jgi:probable HAF family extracellular repeat protein
MQDLGTLGGTFSRANGLNDRGWIAGASRVEDGSFHGFLFRPGHGITDLGPGVAGGPNNRGVSSGFDGSGSPMLFYDGKRVRIPTTPWGLGQYGVGKPNEHNLFVGTFFDVNQTRKFYPFVGSEMHGVVEMKNLIPADSGWQLAFANGLNNKCQIVGEGVYQGRSAIFRLDPIIPPLSIRHAGTNVVLSWTQTFFPLQLEASDAPQSLAWSPVAADTTNALEVSLDRPSRFFRLRLKPAPGVESVRIARVAQPWPVSAAPVLHGTDPYLLIAANGTETQVVLEGVAREPDGRDVNVAWSEFIGSKSRIFATSGVASNVFGLGRHDVQFLASDGDKTTTNRLAFEVVTPAWAVLRLIEFNEQRPRIRSEGGRFTSRLRGSLRALEQDDYPRALAALQQAYDSVLPESAGPFTTVSEDEMENGAILYLLQQLISALAPQSPRSAGGHSDY